LTLAYPIACGTLGPYVVPYEIGAYIDGLGYSAQQAGLLGMLEIGALAAATMLLAPLTSRMSPRVLLIAGSFVAAGAQFASAAQLDLVSLACARVLAGVGSGGMLAAVNSIIAVGDEPERQYGRVYAWMSALFAVLLWVLPHLAGTHEPSRLFGTFGVMALLAVATAMVFPARAAAAQAPQGRSRIPSSRAVLLFGATALAYVALGGTYAFTERVAHASGIPPGTYGALLGASTVAGMLGAWSTGRLGTRHGWSWPLVGGFLASGVSTLAIVGAPTATVFAAGLLAYGALYMFTISYVLGAAATLDRTGRLAVATQGYALLMYAIGPYAFGVMSTRIEQGYAASIAMLMCVAAAVVAWPLSRRLPS
jgi:MFS family permease